MYDSLPEFCNVTMHAADNVQVVFGSRPDWRPRQEFPESQDYYLACMKRKIEREREREIALRPFSLSLAYEDLCSCLGHLQNGCEAMANSLLVHMPHEQTHRAFSILKQMNEYRWLQIKGGLMIARLTLEFL